MYIAKSVDGFQRNPTHNHGLLPYLTLLLITTELKKKEKTGYFVLKKDFAFYFNIVTKRKVIYIFFRSSSLDIRLILGKYAC